MKTLKVLVLLLAVGLWRSEPARADKIFVGKDRSVKTIQQGIDAAKPGDTVLVEKGVYHEREIRFNKSIILKGIDYPVIDGGRKENVMEIHAKDAILEGFRIINSGQSDMHDLAGVLLVDSYNVTIRNNQFDNNTYSILTQHSRNCTIKDNEIKSYAKNEILSGNGIHCWRSDSLIIIGNKISGQRDGIYFEFVTNSLIWRNISHKNIRYGIHFMFSNNDTYIANIFEQNESGVAVMYSNNVNMFNNYFNDNWGGAAYGILLKDISDGEISGNYFGHNTTALELEGCNRLHILKNKFINNGYALKISASSLDNNITLNNFIGNTFDVATNGTLVVNKFNGNYWDKYEGYDLNRDGRGDLPYRPISLYSTIIESNQAALMLFRSIIVSLLDKTEKLLPGITPENLKDEKPYMKPLPL